MTTRSVQPALPVVDLANGIAFDAAAIRALPGEDDASPVPRAVHGAAWSPVQPTPVAAPELLAWSADVAQALGFEPDALASPDFAAVFGGNALLPGMQPFATNYGGHQFGHWAGQLGDGRAITLGEGATRDGVRHELQLKGAGLTPYSRTADGRAVLRSSIREFLCSEAMHHLGVPTTRALSLVATGEAVVRDMFYDGHPQAEPGAIVCRVAPSFLRFGHFELPCSRGEHALLRRLADFCIWRDFPQLLGAGQGAQGDFDALRARGAFSAGVHGRWFAEVCQRTARLVAHWMRVGFVHGVLNTDNMSILGLTIDYGPYGWIDAYDPDWTPNTTDAQGRRYRFGWQPKIAHWNLVRLAQALSPLFGDDIQPLQDGLDRFASAYTAFDRADVAAKLGLSDCRDEDVELMRDLHLLLQAHEVDMTLWFRGLSAVDPQAPSLQPLLPAFYDPAQLDQARPGFEAWLARHAARVGAESPEWLANRVQAMRRANPLYVLRNYLAQEAIDQAEAGDLTGVQALREVMRRPYDEQPGHAHYAGKRPDWARDRAGCSMLSCSS